MVLTKDELLSTLQKVARILGHLANKDEPGPEDLYARLSASTGFVDFIRARAQGYGIRVQFAEPESVDVPAFAGTVTLRYARPVESPSPSSSPGG